MKILQSEFCFLPKIRNENLFFRSSAEATEEEVHFFIRELLSKNLVKSLDNGFYTRVIQNDKEVKLVKQMPKVVKSKQPTIAIITAQYCEKLAVDAMIENKDTYVRYKTEGLFLIIQI